MKLPWSLKSPPKLPQAMFAEPSCLGECPPDIFLAITSHLDRASLLQLRCTSKALSAAVTPTALRNVRFVFDQIVTGNSYLALVNFRRSARSDPLSNLYQHIQHLSIRTQGAYVRYYLNHNHVHYIWETIARMYSLKSVTISWEDGYKDDTKTSQGIKKWQDEICASVVKATEGKLEGLSISLSKSANRIPAALLQLHGLKRLKVVRGEQGWACRIIHRYAPPNDDHPRMSGPCCDMLPTDNGIRDIIRTNPSLEVLEILQGCRTHGFSAEDVLPETLTTLHTITFEGLSFLANPASYLANPAPLENIRHATFTSTYRTYNLDTLWKSMKAARTHLETLRTSQISYHLVDYLASYTGLREFVVRDIQDLPACVGPDVLTPFLDKLLPTHGETLETLDINFGVDVAYIEGLSFSATGWSRAMASMNALRTLCVHPPKPDPYDEEDPKGSELRSIERGYQEIIDTIGHHPSLQHLQIHWPEHWFGCGTGRMSYYTGVRRDLGEVVPKLTTRTGVPRELKLFSGLFTVVEEDGKWRYRHLL